MILDISVVLAYALAMLLLGWYGMRRARNQEEFLVAGRNLGPAFYLGTMAATVLGGAATVAPPRRPRRHAPRPSAPRGRPAGCAAHARPGRWTPARRRAPRR